MGQKPATPNPEYGTHGSAYRGIDTFVAKVVCGVAGAITVASSDTLAQCRMAFVKTAATTGRYTFTLPDKYRRFAGGNITLIGPNTAAWGGIATGFEYFWRANDIDGNNNDGTIELQFVRGDTMVDTELPDNVAFIAEIRAARGI